MADYAQLSNVRLWYDEQGSGAPLVLIHGGVVDARFFAANIPALAEHFRVYAIELRGHGHTADVEGPLTYEALSGDTIEFIEAVIGGPAHVVGHSVGAATALVTALRRPDLVDHLVMISGGFDHSAELGARPGARRRRGRRVPRRRLRRGVTRRRGALPRHGAQGLRHERA